MGYWLRRAWFAFVMLLLTAFAAFVVLELYHGFSEAVLTSSPVRTVVDAAEVLACCAALAWGWRRQRRKYERIRGALERGDTEAAAPERPRAARAVPLALIGRVLIVLMAPLVLPMIAYFLGLVLAGICVREVPAETRARYALRKTAV